MERIAWKHIHYHVEIDSQGNLLYDSGNSNHGSVTYWQFIQEQIIQLLGLNSVTRKMRVITTTSFLSCFEDCELR